MAKKRKIAVIVVTILVLLTIGLIPAILVGALGYYFFLKPSEEKISKKSKKVTSSAEEKEELHAEENDPDAWNDMESELYDQVEEIFNNRKYYANQEIPKLLGKLMDCTTSEERRKSYGAVMPLMQIDLMMLSRDFTGVVFGPNGEDQPEHVAALIKDDKNARDKKFDEQVEKFWNGNGWTKIFTCGVYDSFSNMWYYALKRPFDSERFEEAKKIYNFYNAHKFCPETEEGPVEVYMYDHWEVLASFACFREDPVDEDTSAQVEDIVNKWNDLYFSDENKGQMAAGLKWLGYYKAEYMTICSMEERSPELEQRKAELALIYE